MLVHEVENCVGNWRLVDGMEKKDTIECDKCGARYAATPENRLTAIDENYAGIYLRRLTAEGAKQIGNPIPET